MSKKSRKKAKAKRFGEGSARAAVNAATYGAGYVKLPQGLFYMCERMRFFA